MQENQAKEKKELSISLDMGTTTNFQKGYDQTEGRIDRIFALLMRLVSYAVNRLESTHFRAGTSNSGRK